ncbi:aspartate-semialdehyde dehydrogenase [Musa troglodytarum]|uniref:Aspartate-semialdehyde dehydrogenase n=2 Tax=Musa troglodytarum TaxID=320322 RepID=A0A9E7IEV7_9LILI|nr:aspartate-semialdehyde dehydrogenase [Musa troglodytarum]
MQVTASAHRVHLFSPLSSPALSLPSAKHCRCRYRNAAATTVRMGLREDGPSVAVVGVTGAVGQEFLRVLSDRDFPYRNIRLLASRRSAGKRLTFEDREYTIEELRPESFEGSTSLCSAPVGRLAKSSVRWLSNGDRSWWIIVRRFGWFRRCRWLSRRRSGKGALIANPNCSTIICLMAATPLHRHAKVVRMVVSTYQAASGAGAAAMEELLQQTHEVLDGKQPTCKIFKQQYAFNLFSHNAAVLSNGYNEEEMKLVKETRKIWNDMDVKVTATCIRVPVMRAHAESVNLQFEKPLDEDTARRILEGAAGVTVIDDRESNHFPTPLDVSNKDDVAVGRIRQDLSQDGNQGLDIFVCGDQIRKGAALNAIQIAEKLL